MVITKITLNRVHFDDLSNGGNRRDIINLFDAWMMAEGVDTPELDEQMREAWQLLTDTGIAWMLQGLFELTASPLSSVACVTRLQMGVRHERREEVELRIFPAVL